MNSHVPPTTAPAGRPASRASVRLDSLAVGATAAVVGVEGPALLRERLVELGFTKGQRVVVLSRAAGSAVRVQLRGGSIALRRDEAELVCIHLPGGSNG